MAQIKVTAGEFPNIIICYLLECIRDRKELPFDNPLFENLLDKMFNSGIRANLLWEFMNMDGNFRIKYKMIRDSLFNEGMDSSLIRVIPDKEIEDETG
jgi:hypothetical protein